MNDDQAQATGAIPAQNSASPTSSAQPSPDPLASLEELLNKAKAKRSPSANGGMAPADVPAGPSPEEIAAQEQARLAEQQAQLAQQEQAAEVDRLQQLEEQRQKMANELQNTPEYQARQQQNQEEAQKQEEQKEEQQGHVIHQVSDDKV